MENVVDDFNIQTLGEAKIKSPLNINYHINPDKRLLYNAYLRNYDHLKTKEGLPLSVEVAGPREKIFFDPSKTKAAIVTCGGLCPGINDVIRSIVMELYHRYGVRNVVGFQYGFQGLIPQYGHALVELFPEYVKDIHNLGGSILSSSRGNQKVQDLVDTLRKMNVNIFFCIGGDGTIRAAYAITEEINRKKLSLSVIGIPKTIDNDLNLIQKSFGFDTAIAEAEKVIQCAHVEAKGAPMGIGLIKIMGRQSGHIAASATLAQGDVNLVLIPEVPFDLYGKKGFLHVLENRLKSRGHCVIMVAEGAGQELMQQTHTAIEKDVSGNIKLFDIGIYLKNKIEAYFKKIGMVINIKYFDPSYIIRSVRANASDSIYCSALGQYAVHAGMAGKTGMLVGLMKDEYVHIPLKNVMSRTRLDPSGNIWMRVLESTGQPASMKN